MILLVSVTLLLMRLVIDKTGNFIINIACKAILDGIQTCDFCICYFYGGFYNIVPKFFHPALLHPSTISATISDLNESVSQESWNKDYGQKLLYFALTLISLFLEDFILILIHTIPEFLGYFFPFLRDILSDHKRYPQIFYAIFIRGKGSLLFKLYVMRVRKG
jgi:hypothetical protein